MNRAWMSGNDIIFWDEIERAAFLITNLNDRDVASDGSRLAINRIHKNKTEACQLLFEAWCYIKLYADESMERGYLLDEHWLYRLEAASEHIMFRCISQLKNAELAAFEDSLKYIYVDVARTRNPTNVLSDIRVISDINKEVISDTTSTTLADMVAA